MGKLHTLRRAIERDPQKWRNAQGAKRDRAGEWWPAHYPQWFWRKPAAYRRYIRWVLGKIDRRRA